MQVLERVVGEIWDEARANKRLLAWVALGVGALWLVRHGIRGFIRLAWTLFGLGMAWYWAGGAVWHRLF
jgi:hypothetical protein